MLAGRFESEYPRTGTGTDESLRQDSAMRVPESLSPELQDMLVELFRLLDTDGASS